MIDLIDKKHFISFLDFVIVDRYIYFSNDTFNALVQVDKETKEVVHMEPFLGAPLDKAHMHTGCIRYGNQIFFYAVNEPRIHVFDLESREQFVVATEGIQGGFFVSDICEGELYFLPTNLKNGIGKYHSARHSLEKVSWYHNVMQGRCRYSNMAPNVWVAFGLLDYKCAIIDLSKKSVHEFFTKHMIQHLDYNEGNFWYVSPDKGSVYLRSMEMETEEEYTFENWRYANLNGRQYANIFVVEKNVFLISGDTRRIFVMDQNKMHRRELIAFTEEAIDHFVPFEYHVRKKRVGDTLYLFFQQRNVIVGINLITLAAETISLDFYEDKKVIDYLAQYNYEYAVIMPDDTISLNQFIDLSLGNTDNS